MIKKLSRSLVPVLVLSIILVPVITAKTTKAVSDIGNDLKGYFLMEVEGNGQIWYITPDKGEKILVGGPDTAFGIIRKYGLGIKADELDGYLKSSFPERLKATILLNVEQNGEAYYVNPTNMEGYYLGRPDTIMDILKKIALGINNKGLAMIRVSNDPLPIMEGIGGPEDYNIIFPPTVVTYKPELMRSFTRIITVKGEVSGRESEDVDEKGMIWGKESPLTFDTALQKIEDGAGVGKIMVDIVGLEPAKTYYIRAYAILDDDVFYGNEEVIGRWGSSNKTPPTLNSSPTIQYTLEYLTSGCGSIDGDASQIIYRGNDGTTVTANPCGGWSFSGWDDGLGTSTRTDTNITEDITVTATFFRPE
jgi:hypothetical protein